MTRELPSYVVRNLVEVALKRSDRRKTKKPDGNSTLCVAVPIVKDTLDAEQSRLEDAKSLLKLHKRFEDEALRTLRKGIVEKRPSTKLSNNSTVRSQRTDKNEDYLNDISLKLAQVPSPDLPTKFPALGSTTRQLQWSASRRLEPLTFPQKGAICKVYPERARGIHIRPYSCPSSLFLTENGILPREEGINKRKKLRSASIGESSHNFQDLQKHLTVFPLTSGTFAAYDSLPRFNEADPFSGTMVRDDIGSSRNSDSPVLWLVPRDDPRSEDALSVNYEKYLTDDADRRDVVSDFADESSCRALVEYKPIYRKNVRFSEDLHEIHLYSPVQNHRTRRRRGRRRRTEEDH